MIDPFVVDRELLAKRPTMIKILNLCYTSLAQSTTHCLPWRSLPPSTVTTEHLRFNAGEQWPLAIDTQLSKLLARDGYFVTGIDVSTVDGICRAISAKDMMTSLFISESIKTLHHFPGKILYH